MSVNHDDDDDHGRRHSSGEEREERGFDGENTAGMPSGQCINGTEKGEGER